MSNQSSQTEPFQRAIGKVDQKKTTKSQHQHRHDRAALDRVKQEHTKWIDHTKSVAVGVCMLLAVALRRCIKMCKNMLKTHRHPLQPLFFGLAKQKKKLISTARNARKKRTLCHYVIATKKNQKTKFRCAEISRSMHFLSDRLFTNVNAATRGFRSGRMFMHPFNTSKF